MTTAAHQDEFQATDDGAKVLLGRFTDDGMAVFVIEITPEAADELAKQLRNSAGLARSARCDKLLVDHLAITRPLSDTAVSEVTDFLGMMLRHTRGES